jgi:hypothetical protein
MQILTYISSCLTSVKEIPDRRRVFIWFFAYLIIAGFIQFFVVSAPYDADTAYHAVVGRLIREHGMLHAFPWTPFSWLAENYADKELILHLLFAPLAHMDWVVASKIVGTLLGGILLFVIYIILRAEKVRFAGIWTLLPLVTSDVFLFRFALVRPHLLSISLAMVLLWALLRGRLVPVIIFSALYPWSYVAFWQLPLILIGTVETVRFLSGARPQWKPAAAVTAGIVVGLVLHPNSTNLLKFNWIHMVDVLFRNAWQARGGIELGVEFLPFTLHQWLTWLLAAVAMVIVGLVLGWRERKNDYGLLAFALAAVTFGILSSMTARFAEYFIPFAAVTMALASRYIPWRWITIAVFATALLYTGKPLSETLEGLKMRQEVLPSPLASWMRQQIPVGSQIFTTEWGLTGTLMLALPERRFIVALDPTLFLIRYPDLYHIWFDLPRHPYPGMAETIRKRFGARFVISFSDERFTGFYRQLSMEPGVKPLLLTDENWTIFDLGIR